jgi:hypothetical protein
MNKAELLVYRLCRKSFLSLWSYMNPRRKPSGKELCDVIVVCEPDVLIVSVKHTRSYCTTLRKTIMRQAI